MKIHPGSREKLEENYDGYGLQIMCLAEAWRNYNRRSTEDITVNAKQDQHRPTETVGH